MKVFPSHRVPIKSWCNDPENEALSQAGDLANLPFVFKHYEADHHEWIAYDLIKRLKEKLEGQKLTPRQKQIVEEVYE